MTKQVQEYLQEIKEKNSDIVAITQEKENIESKMKLAVDEAHLRVLQQEHDQLIKSYEGIIKTKIDIFTEMIKDLGQLIDGNSRAIKNEEAIADLKLVTEVWERDIYQKKRVEMDTQVDIRQMEGNMDY